MSGGPTSGRNPPSWDSHRERSTPVMLALLVSVANTFYQTSQAQSAAPQAIQTKVEER